MPLDAVQREMAVASLLSEMEVVGLGFDPWLLVQQGVVARSHLGRLEEQAAAIAGHPFNLSSSAQLARVLYEELHLRPPAAHGRAAAKTHAPTDEAALNQLKQLSPLPALVLQHRWGWGFGQGVMVAGELCWYLVLCRIDLARPVPACRAITNFLSKFVQPEWVQQATGRLSSTEAYAAEHGYWPRVHCCWNQTQTATGRLSSASPNLQASVAALWWRWALEHMWSTAPLADCPCPAYCKAVSPTHR